MIIVCKHMMNLLGNIEIRTSAHWMLQECHSILMSFYLRISETQSFLNVKLTISGCSELPIIENI